jgi:hypothetical protein
MTSPPSGAGPDAVAGATTAPSSSPSSWVRRLGEDVTVALPAWVAARALVALAWWLASAIANRWYPSGTTLPLSMGLTAWDGSYYRDIAERGYHALPPDALRFFPLYPLLGRLFGLGGGHAVALVVLANVGALLAAAMMRRLVLVEGHSVETAERAAWITSLFPASFVLVWAYAEALFLVLAVGSFLAVRRRHFALAAALAFAAGLTRPVGILLAAPLAVEAVRTWWVDRRLDASADRSADRSGRGIAGSPLVLVGRGSAALAPVAGCLLYLGWVGRSFGDWTLPISVQSSLRGNADPFTRLWQGIGDMIGSQRFGDGLHIPFVLAFIVLLVVLWRRWPVAYGVYATLVLLVALSAENLNSVERYALDAFPLLLALAGLLTTRTREQLALAVCGCGLLSFAALAWLMVYVP